MLRGVVGDEAFWAGIREYYRQYQNESASTDDFRRAMEEASGRELGWFFDQWLTRGGMLKVQARWAWDAAAGEVRLEVEQRQAGSPYRMPIEVELNVEGQAEPRIERIELEGTHGTFAVPLDREPRSVVLDPRTFVLMDVETTPADSTP
jgi:aminopeptidase N